MAMDNKHDEKLYLLGFLLNEYSKEPDLYTLMAYGDNDRAITKNGKIIFFNNISLANKALRDANDENIKKLGLPPQELALLCDIPNMLHLIEYNNVDNSSVILNCLNTMFDLIKSIDQSLPFDYKNILYNFADFLTFRQEYSIFLKNNIGSRKKLGKAITWCVDTIFMKEESRILLTNEPHIKLDNRMS